MELSRIQHIQHVQWLQAQLADSENKLAEARNIAAEAERSVTYVREMLKLVSDIPDIKDDIDTNEADIKDDINTNEAGIKRTPKQMLLPDYADKPIIDAIHQYLSHLKTEVAIDDLIQDVFDVQTENEFRRVKAAVWTEMRRGHDNGMWQRVGKSSWFIPQDKEMPILEAIAKATAVEDEDARTEERVLMLAN